MPARAAGASVGLVVVLALQTAIPPFATDTYTPAFPQVTTDLQTTAAAVGVTLTMFFLGLGAGQLVGGPLSDRFGRRPPLIVGGIVCALGAVGCALAPSIGVLIAMRLVQGFGGGIATTVARAVLVDVARGDALAKAMSLLMALGGLAPAIAPVVGGVVLSAGGTWRVIFWILVGFGVLMSVTAALFVPESLPRERRHAGGFGSVLGGFGAVLRRRAFVGYMLTAALAGFGLIAYVANASYVVQGMNGVAPLPFSLFFASTALAQVALSVVNARLIGRLRPQRLIAFGLAAAAAAIALLTASTVFWNTALIPMCIGFFVLMAAQAFVFGNAAALAASTATEHVGSASALIGIAQSLAMAIAAPVASSGGVQTALPMVLAMLVGITGATTAFAVARRAPAAR
jgi:DHA1 family bicyclomycin/chloramphenicol resistance-like MFS transporter